MNIFTNMRNIEKFGSMKNTKKIKIIVCNMKRKNIKTCSNIENHGNIQIVENMKTQNHEKILKKMENISITKI